ncbi:hypothetical protein [Streptomyces sp. AK04-3B]|uniref:hypothetical protein n=1 Tax=Streptomyces sp. AK04-3B TaxID=3028650 RepID=UPI0029A427A7|nr:hypothetical protein [Streptomyces sp. AK04-3B]MDX3799155.1 hypothetical protein [Streptomyces sp. AK04-3B]
MSGSVVDGHSIHGADGRRAADTDSSRALRRRYGQAVVSVRDSLGTSKATKRAGHSPAARAVPTPLRARSPLEWLCGTRFPPRVRP